MLLQSFRMTLRDWRAGELHFLMAAIIVAVASLSSVGFFVDRMRSGMERDARQLLGADLVIVSDKPLPDEWREQARRWNLNSTETLVFLGMALTGSGDITASRLVSVKAVAPGYPLRGKLKISQTADDKGATTDGIPDTGTVWVDPSLLPALKLQTGDNLRLGDRSFRVAKLIALEPDRGASFLSFAPRVMLQAEDLASTGLVQAGSRITYRLLLAGADAGVASYREWAQKATDSGIYRGVRLESLETGRPEMRTTLDRGERFLSLVSLLSAMLAAVAIGMAARRFMLRHLDACAMLRCLGLTQGQVTKLYLFEFLMVGLLAAAIGAFIGYAAHFVLLDALGRLVFKELPPASLLPAVQSIFMGLLLLLGFALPPVLQLRDVPHNRVIRREAGVPNQLTLLSYALGLGAFLALLLWQAGDHQLGWMTAAGFFAGVVIFSAVAWLGLRSLRLFRGITRHPDWHFALTSLQRRPGAVLVQVVSLAMGLMALLLLSITRADLMDAWRKATPPDAPNRFLINIQPDQKREVEARLRTAGVKDATLYPMIRGRLVQLNGQEVSGAQYVDSRAKRLVEREFNLSTMAEIPKQNKIVAGRWFDDTATEASVEEGLAQTLGLQLGDSIAFQIAGSVVEAKIASLRRLEWGSMRVNFFVILNPKAMKDMPHSWITAYHLPPSHAAFDHELSNDFPNLTVIDMGSLIRQVQEVMEQVISAVEFLFLFTLASGLMVLYAALLGSHDERIRESALLRALGATRKQLRNAQTIELSLLGALAGLLSAMGAVFVGWILAVRIFQFPLEVDHSIWFAGLIAGAACALAGGWFGLRGVLTQPPMRVLRE